VLRKIIKYFTVLCAVQVTILQAEALTSKDIKQLTSSCQNEDFKSCFLLGWDLHVYHVEEISQAIELYKKACDGQYMNACYNLANIYNSNEKLDPNKHISTKLYKKACESNYPGACYNYGISNFFHLAKLDKGINLFKKSCNANLEFSSHSCVVLAEIYGLGNKVKKDLKKAMFYDTKACQYNNVTSCYRIANILLANKKIETNIARGKEFLAKACKLHLEKACEKLDTIKYLEKTNLLNKQVFFRNDFSFHFEQTAQGASAFFIRHKEKTYVVTAKHLLGEGMGIMPWVLPSTFDKRLNYWRVINPMDGKQVYVGRIKKPNDDWELDIIMFPLEEKIASENILTIATTEPKVFDQLFIIGCPYEETKCTQNIYPLLYRGMNGTQLMFTWPNKNVSSKGFSGAPIVNAKGEVVATYVGYTGKQAPYDYLGESINAELARFDKDDL
jgi:hypothetical protein